MTRDTMSHVSYDSHVISRRRMADELPRVEAAEGGGGAGRSQELLDTEIARVGRELYCTVFYCSVLCCTVLNYAVLYCTGEQGAVQGVQWQEPGLCRGE